MADDPLLPDLLAHDLRIVFCGTAAGSVSARVGAYYAGPGNAFWPTLYQVGLTPRLFRPREYAQLLPLGLGCTDLAKHTSGVDGTLIAAHFDAGRLLRRIADYCPRVVAFTGKRAAGEFFGRPVEYGLQAERLGTTGFFVLPSPSGAARRFWSLRPWQDLAAM